MATWLLKTEPEVYSIDDLKRDRRTAWHGVRNYQARNFLRQMKVGDRILFYHSQSEPPGVAGIAEVSREAFPDPSQFDKKSEFFDAKASKETPRWFCPEVKFVEKAAKLLPLSSLRDDAKLKDMILLKRGSRLSVQPVSDAEFKRITEILSGSKN